MNIDYAMSLQNVWAIDNQDPHQDVVKKVSWVVEFFDTNNPDIKSTGGVESYLDTDSISADTFTPYENLTQTQILQWALDAEGGTAFLDQLLEGGHAAHLEKQIQDASYTYKDVALLPES
ncbi:hypothetical protein [Alteromonas mediterranea]|uniref:DUF7936 family protein n=1 Tax=Alteromonas mediterranea TaxID=314275 RepID=UPI0032B116B2|tara:strand:+ start:687 stop:1046 length:360 start_codon:yes stop_codon:yes gene_type:complete